MDIIGHKYIFLVISGVLVLVSVFAIGAWGLKLGVDFTGGSLMEVAFPGRAPAVQDVAHALEPLGLGTVLIQLTSAKELTLRFRHVDEATHQKILSSLSSLQSPTSTLEARLAHTGGNLQPSAFGLQPPISEKRFDTIGPTIGEELKRRSIAAVALAIAAIIVYIAWAFRRVSLPVASWKYGIAALVALVHDVAIPAGAFAFLGHFRAVEVDSLFITALLTILGFSVHDTIVVFDRIRENLRKLKSPELFSTTVNRSVNETLVRSLMTSVTVLLVLFAILFLGGSSVRYFALALIIGITFGTYSSIFVASPLLVIWNNWTNKK